MPGEPRLLRLTEYIYTAKEGGIPTLDHIDTHPTRRERFFYCAGYKDAKEKSDYSPDHGALSVYKWEVENNRI